MMMEKPAIHECFAFTSDSHGKVNRLINEAKVQSKGNENTYLALWDTGAAITCISKKVATDLRLIPTGYITIQGSSGSARKPTYYVDIVLRNNVCIKGVRVSEAEIGSQGIDLLIGMDIIGFGDFAVSNFEDNTVFTFRIPSVRRTDYVAEINHEKIMAKIGTHGKGNTRRRHK